MSYLRSLWNLLLDWIYRARHRELESKTFTSHDALREWAVLETLRTGKGMHIVVQKRNPDGSLEAIKHDIEARDAIVPPAPRGDITVLREALEVRAKFPDPRFYPDKQAALKADLDPLCGMSQEDYDVEAAKVASQHKDADLERRTYQVPVILREAPIQGSDGKVAEGA